MVVGTQEPHPATILHADVATVSTLGYVGCPQQRKWATKKCAGGGGCRREVLWGSALSDKSTGALTERLPLEVIEVRLKARGVLLCGIGTGGNMLYFDCPPVRCASTGGQKDRMCWRSELCRSICVSVRWSASGGGTGRGGGIRGCEDNSTGGRDSRLRVSRINASCSSLHDRKWDQHIRSPCCHVTRGLRIGFRNAKRDRARSP